MPNVAVPTDFHTDDPGQLRVDLEKLARAVKALDQRLDEREPRWTPTDVRRVASDVEFGQAARFSAAVAARLPIATTAERGRTLSVEAMAAVTVVLTARGGQTIEGSATQNLAGPGLWIVMWDGERFSVCP